MQNQNPFINKAMHEALQHTYPMCDSRGMRPSRTTTQVVQAHEGIILAAIYNILFTNELALGYTINAVSCFKRDPLYRHECKRLANNLYKQLRGFERKLNHIMGEVCKEFADKADLFEEHIKADDFIERLRLCMKNDLDRERVSYTPQALQLLVAQALLYVAGDKMDFRIKELTDIDYNFHRLNIGWLNTKALFKSLCHLLFKAYPQVDLCHPSQATVSTLRFLGTRLDDPSVLKESISHQQ